MNIYIKKMGCKVNEYEASSISTTLQKRGHNEVADVLDADVAIVFTCAVTNEAESKSRQAVSKIYKANPNIKIIVCGCSSQNDSKQYSQKDGVIAVVGMNKIEILNIIEDIEKNSLREYQSLIPNHYEKYEIPNMHKTRHFVKIQDGCNNFCTYCLIPYLRGRSRSRDFKDVIDEIMIASKHSKEIVITGIDVSDYKSNEGKTLIDLIKHLKNYDIRFRFSSLECSVISEELLLFLKDCVNFCPHFHLSMQSGANKTLRDMNRHYTKEMYLEKVSMIRKYFPDCGITTDVIVGFPTESDEDFEETLQTIRQASFSDIHCFPYSLRKGTAISKIAKPLDGNIVKERQQVLLQLKKELHNKFLKKNLGKTASVLTENVKDKYIVGYTKEYIKVMIPKEQVASSQIVDVKLVEIVDDYMIGKIER